MGETNFFAQVPTQWGYPSKKGMFSTLVSLFFSFCCRCVSYSDQVSYESGQTRPILFKEQKNDLKKVQVFKVKEAKDFITVEGLAENPLGLKPTRKALAAKRERSIFVKVFFCTSNSLF